MANKNDSPCKSCSLRNTRLCPASGCEKYRTWWIARWDAIRAEIRKRMEEIK